MQVCIRFMKREDVREVAEIEKECFSVPWSADGFLEALKTKRNIFLTAAEEAGEQRVLGYIGMYTAADEGEITNVAVTCAARNTGIGARLTERAVSEAEKIGVRNIYLEVRVSNAAAVRLYEKCGFQKCGVRKKFYSRPVEDAFVMVRRIGGLSGNH